MAKNNYNWKILDGSKKMDKKYPKWLLDILANRNIDNIEAFLKPNYKDLESFDSFLNTSKSVKRIKEAKKKNEKIVVYGDYDVDGICATALVFEVLNKIGIQNVETYIPHREEEGYGLNKGAVDSLKKDGANLIITVDCGVTSGKLIDAEKDVDFIIIDHHETDAKKVSKKAVILHPKLVKKGKEKQPLCGCGMAFFWALAIKNEFKEEFAEGQEKWLLDLVALATICDVVPLVGQNRILVKWGLLVLSKTKRVGLTELMKISSIDKKDVNTYAVGFVLGPRLNASGRIEHAKKSLDLVLSKNKQQAMEIAQELDTLNTERRKMCNKISADAKAEVEGSEIKNNTVILLANKNWARGVVGIIASRIADIYHRPTIIFEEKDGELHGSARSIESFNITEALAKSSNLLIKYGGHAKAAGVSLISENLSKFNEKLNKIAEKKIKKEDLIKSIKIDSTIKEKEVDENLMDWLEKLEPFGYGNHTPVFLVEDAVVLNIKRVGAEKEHIKFTAGEKKIGAILFRDERNLEEGKRYDLVVNVKYNEWNGQKNIEYKMIDLKEK